MNVLCAALALLLAQTVVPDNEDRGPPGPLRADALSSAQTGADDADELRNELETLRGRVDALTDSVDAQAAEITALSERAGAAEDQLAAVNDTANSEASSRERRVADIDAFSAGFDALDTRLVRGERP